VKIPDNIRRNIKKKKPVRPYKSFADYTQWVWGHKGYSGYNVRRLSGGEWPCIFCGGNSTIYDPDDPPCPIEGNKMRDRIKCPSCNGTGKGNKEVHQKTYKETVNRYKRDMEQYKLNVEAVKSGLEKLTDIEYRAIGEFENSY